MTPPGGLPFPVLLLYRLAEATIVAVHEHYDRPSPPSLLPPVLTREMSVGLIYQFPFSTPADPDVVRRRLVLTVNGTELPPVEVPFDFNSADNPIPENPDPGFAAGDEVVAVGYNIDDAGNASAGSAPYSFLAADTLPPSAPDQLSAVLVRETPDAE